MNFSLPSYNDVINVLNNRDTATLVILIIVTSILFITFHNYTEIKKSRRSLHPHLKCMTGKRLINVDPPSPTYLSPIDVNKFKKITGDFMMRDGKKIIINHRD